MPQYKAPGVYVEEVERGAKPIEGVGTRTAGFLGETERGPTDPRLLTSYADYQRHFGGVVENKYLAQAVEGFFQNGGTRCYVGRITAAQNPAEGNLSPHSPNPDTLGAGESTLDFGRVEEYTLDFGRIESGTPRTRTLAVRNLGERRDDQITITDLGTSDDADDDFEVLTKVPEDGFTLDPGETQGVAIEFAPDDGGGESETTADLDVSLEREDATATEVTLKGTAVEAGDGVLGTSTDTLDFGAVPDGNTWTETVTLENLGGTDVTLTDAGTPDNGAFDVRRDIAAENITIEGGDSADLEVEFDADGAGTKEATLEPKYEHDGDEESLEIHLTAHVTESVIRLKGVGPGAWGRGVTVTVDDGSLFDPETEAQDDLFQVTVRYWSDDDTQRTAIDVLADPMADDDDLPNPDVERVYDNLSTDEESSDYYGTQLEGNSKLIDVDEEESESGRRPANGIVRLGIDEDDPDVEAKHFEGDDPKPEKRTGLAAFGMIDEISMVCIPDEHVYDRSLSQDIVDHCTNQKDRFAILQSKQEADGPGALEPSVRSDFAAFYYPWLTIGHPETGRDQPIPPGGHVAGIYARSDQEHGVHKAPANEQVRGIRELQKDISKGDQAILNPRGVNCIRTFRGRGTRVWGARTTSSDPAWKYVNVRRLFLFIEESIDEGTQWVVFEPNNEQLWARVRQTIRNFLTSVWDDGALMGTTPEEAFFVKCDRSTMTQNDIDNGRLICEIGIAPVKPAEFVVFRISQTTADAEG